MNRNRSQTRTVGGYLAENLPRLALSLALALLLLFGVQPPSLYASQEASLTPGETRTSVVADGEVEVIPFDLREGDLAQLRVFGPPGLGVELVDPDGRRALPLGGWVEGYSLWALVRGDRFGTWQIQLTSSARPSATVEVEWTLRTEWPANQSPINLSNNFRSLGLEAADGDDWGGAEAWLAAALSIAEEELGTEAPGSTGLRGLLGRLLFSWGLVEESGRDFEAAARLLERAEDLASNAGGSSVLRSLYRDWASIEAGLAREARDQGDMSAAIGKMSHALELQEKWAAHSPVDERIRAMVWQEGDDIAHSLVTWLVQEGRSDEAFEYAERGRGRAQLDQIRGDVPYRSDLTLERRRDSLTTRFLELTVEMERGDVAPNQAAAIRGAMDALEQEFSEIYSQLRLPRAPEDSASGVRPLDVIQRDVVPESGLLLFYEIGEPTSYLFVLPSGGRPLQVFDLGFTEAELRPALMGRIEGGPSILDELTQFRRGWGFERPGRILNALWEILVPAEAWELVARANEVVIVPDAWLYYLPFDALVVEPAAAVAETVFWLDAGPPIRYSSSASALAALRERSATTAPRERARLLTVTNPAYDSGSESTPAFAPLPGTTLEAEVLSNLVGEANSPPVFIELSGADASEDRVRGALSTVEVAHLATHGLSGDQWPGLFTSLALSPPERPGDEPSDDGLLQLHEIYGLDLKQMELIVLSACSTSLGERWGEGVFALSGGFLAAGVDRVVTTFWAVNDFSTSFLVGAFFERSVLSPSVPESYTVALRDAKRVLRSNTEWAHPYFWAPFALSGLR